MGVKERYESKNKKSNSTGVKARYDKRIRKSQLETTIGFDTFESDLNSLGKTVKSIYEGWQTEETLNNTRSSIEAMQGRISAYQDYQKQYGGGADLTKLSKSYEKILGNWDKISSDYGKYKSADEYNTAKKEYEGKTKANLDDVQKEIDSLSSTLKQAEEIEGRLRNANRSNAMAKGRAKGVGLDLTDTSGIKDELNSFLKKNGYSSVKELRDAVDGKKFYLEDAQKIQDEIKLNKEETERAKSKEGKQGYEKWLATKQEKENKEKNKSWIETAMEFMAQGDTTTVGGNMGTIVNEKRKDDSAMTPNEKWTEKQKYAFGSYWLEDPNKAFEYGARINDLIGKEEQNKKNSDITESATSDFWSGVGHTAGAILTAPLGLADYLDDVTSRAAGKPIVETGDVTPFEYSQTVTSGITNKLNDISGTLDEDIPIIGGKGLGDLYGLGTSIAQSAASAYALGGWGTLVSYLGQGAAAGVDDALSRGATEEQALLYGTIVGAAEGVSEKIGIDNLFKIGSSRTLKELFVNILKQGGAEGLEEGFSSVVGNIADDWINQGKSNFDILVKEYMAKGMSASEAKEKAWAKSLGDIAYDVIGGFVSGAAHAGPRTAVATLKENVKAKAIGQTVRGNERVAETLELASLTPQESDAYNLYTQYAKKGVNAENINDKQLGHLYSSIKANATDVLNSKESSSEQKESAKKTLTDLSAYSQDNSASKLSKKAIKTLYDSESTEALISEGLESGKDTESYKLAEELKAKADKGQKITTEEIARLADANQDAYKVEVKADVEARLSELGATSDDKLTDIIVKKSVGEKLTTAENETLQNSKVGNRVYNEINNEELVGYTENMDESDKGLFLSLYDGKTDVEAYAKSYDLVSQYAKGKFTDEYIFEHKGVLSATQATAIIGHKISSKIDTQKNAIAALKEKHKNAPHIYGIVDDSVIDYENANTEGKVNWSSITKDQRNAITVLGSFAIENGMDVELIIDGKERGINGAFSIQSNKILIDVYAGMDKADLLSNLKNLIFPTFSHELTHWMKEKSPELYRKYSAYVIESLKTSTGLNEMQILERRRRKMEAAHPGEQYTDDDVRDEVIARASEDMLGKSKTMREFVDSLTDTEKRTFVDKVKEILQKLKEWFENYINKNLSVAQEAEDIRAIPERIEGQIKLFDEMLADSIAANQALKNEGITGEELARKVGSKVQKNTTDGDVQFALREDAKTEVKTALTNKHYNQEIKLTDSSPSILLAQKGVKNLPMMMKASHIRENIFTEEEAKKKGFKVNKNINYHGLGEELFYKVIDGLDEVKEAYRGTKNAENSERRENYFLLISQYTDKDGNIINVPVYINEKGLYNRVFIDTNKIATVFGKNEFRKYIREQLNKGNLVRIKNRSIQTSESTSPINADYGENTSKDSIHQNNPKSQEQIQNSDRDSLGNTLTEAQQSYFAESKVRDENGNLMVMYHGTPNATFTKFRSGTYFTEHKWYADNYQNQGASSLSYKKTADNPDTYAVYLDIKKPFDTRNKKERDIWYKEFYLARRTSTDLRESGLVDWLDGEDLQEFLEEKGYDYDGLILDEGATGGYGEEVKSRGFSYVVFNPEQVKSVDNKNPTKDADYRFSDREINKNLNLIAVHGTKEEKLLKALKLEGLPGLSTAVINIDDGLANEDYGEISLVFDKRTIDPTLKGNAVYGADIWSPTQSNAQVERQTSSKGIRQFESKISDLAKNVVGGTFAGNVNLGGILYTGSDATTLTIEDLSYRFDRNDTVMAAYLASQGKDVEPIMKPKTYHLKYDNESLAYVLSKFQDDVYSPLSDEMLDIYVHSRDYEMTDVETQKMANIFKELMLKRGMREELAEKLVKNHYAKDNNEETYKLLDAALRYDQDGRPNEETVDRRATSDAMEEIVSKDWDSYRKWIAEQLTDAGVFTGEEGLFNKTDRVTNSGRKTFKQSHIPITAENIVKLMNKEENRGVGYYGFGVEGIQSLTATKYSNIDSIRADKGRLKKLDSDEYNAIISTYNQKLTNLVKEIAEYSDVRLDMVSEAFKDAAKGARTTLSIRKAYSFYDIKISDELIKESQNLYNEVAQIPSKYFEAKASRVVGFNEIRKAIIPDSSSRELVYALKEKGIPYTTYKRGDNEERLEIIRSLDDVKFSDRDSSGNPLSKEQIEFFKDSKVRDKDGNLLVVRHGTSEDFHIFDFSKAGKNGKAEGAGFYFSDEKEITKRYGDIQKEVYLNITKPMYNNKRTVKKAELVTFVNALIDFDNEKWGTEWKDSFISNYINTYEFQMSRRYAVQRFVNQIWEYNENDQDLIFEVAQADGRTYENSTMKEFYDVLTESIGYDGIIAEWSHSEGKSNVYVTFNSEQSKYVSNTNPTGSLDMRYEDREISYGKLTQNRIDYLIEDSGAGSRVDYANMWVASINPSDFIDLTLSSKTRNKGREVFDTEVEGDFGSVMGDRDYISDLKESREMPYLSIDMDTGKVTGHNGRHRMRALEKAGATRTPVGIKFYKDGRLYKGDSNGVRLEAIDLMRLTSQFDDKFYLQLNAYIHDIIPLNEDHRSEIEEKYLAKPFETRDGWAIAYEDRETKSVHDELHEVTGERDRLLKENKKFKEDVERLKERLKLERQVTNGNYFNQNQLSAVAGHLRKLANSDFSKPELVKMLDDVYSYIAHSENLNWDDLYAKCYEVAKELQREARPIVETNHYAKDVLDEIRRKPIALSDTQKKEIEYATGMSYRKAFWGKVTIDDNGISLDQRWNSLADVYPGTFDRNATEGDQVVQLRKIYEDMRDTQTIFAEYDEEAETRWIAKEVYNQYWNVSTIRTTADKYDKQIKRLNFEHRKAMKEFRDDYQERLKAQHKADRERTQELVKKIRERKDKEIAEVKKLGRERMDAYKENAERKTKIQTITANALTLNKWLVKNSKDEHIHVAMRGPVINLLQAIDFSSKQLLGMKGSANKGTPTQKDISLQKALSDVKDMMADASVGKEGLIELYGHGLDDDIKELVKSVDNMMRTVGDNEFVLNKMSLAELETLDKIVKTIKHAVSKMNKFHTVQHKQGIANLSEEGIEYLDKLGKAVKHSGVRGKLDNLLKWINTIPYYAFKRLGVAGKKVFEALQDGWDKLAYNVKQITDFTNETYTSKEVREWSKQAKTFTINQPDGSKRTFDMSIAQIMALHCVAKQEDAQRHLLASGMTIAEFDNKGNVSSEEENILLGIDDIATITGTLDKRQLEVANKLQEFMNTVCATWGNEVSMQRFAIEMFTTPDYFPIKVSPATITKEEPKDVNDVSLFRLLNMSFTKSRNEFANQSIEIGNIFDIFAQHTSDMAKYNALALPVLDAYRWYSYKGQTNIGKEYSTYASLQKALGKDSVRYFNTFMKDLNGASNVARDNFGSNFFRNAKLASVAANLRVVLLQPTAYLKASAVIDNRYLTQALLHKPKIAKAEKYCGMALWKSMGYYDVNITKGLTEKIKHDDTWRDKAIEFSMKGAEVADKVTFGYLWNACELEIRKTRKDLKVGSEEFYTTIGKRLREIIYATQVVDSTMTRSQIMRSPDGWDKMLTAFMSEPTLAYNMLMDCVITTNLDKRENGKGALKRNFKRNSRVFLAYVTTNILAALVESCFDVFRDDEEDEDEDALVEFARSYLTNFTSDMSIIGKIPYFKEIPSLLQGYSPSRTDTQWMESFVYAGEAWAKIFTGEGEGKGVKAVEHSLRAFSNVSGLAFFNAYRDLMAALNKLDVLTAEELEELFDELFGY